jgi:prepilin-type N-terminal cleavage/methylation domain-containing protein
MRTRGYTLVEILVVVGILAVLAALLIPAVMGGVVKGREAQCQMNLVKIYHALATYRQDNGAYPNPAQEDVLAALVNAKFDRKDVTCPLDPIEGNPTYMTCYNFWGYKKALEPEAFASKAEASGIYTSLTTETAEYWNGRYNVPGMRFPGLANNTPPPTTIVTVCPNHVDSGKYLALRLSGDVDVLRTKTLTNLPADKKELFWTLSIPTSQLP